MQFDGTEQVAIIELMHGKYGKILGIEGEWGIRLHEGDMRPRIEHFHDAVRALTSGSADMYAKNSRLSVENLAYDIGQLRQVQGKPVGLINRATEKSTGSALVKQGEEGAATRKLPPAAVRGQLVGLYRDYTVFFAALFVEAADLNYQSRMENMEQSQADLQLIEEVMSQLIAGKISTAQALHELMHVEEDRLRERISGLLAKKGVSAREMQDAKALMTQIKHGQNEEKKRLETAHLHYATGQLAVYEEGKETLKRLQQQGLNLAGKFVENAMRGAGQDKGRGV